MLPTKTINITEGINNPSLRLRLQKLNTNDNFEECLQSVCTSRGEN